MSVYKNEILDVEVRIGTKLGVIFINLEFRKISFSTRIPIFSFTLRGIPVISICHDICCPYA